MHILKPTFKVVEFSSSENRKFLKIPSDSYETLKEDFTVGSHFNVIDQLNLKKINGVYIRASNETDALLSAIYCYKKYIADNEAFFTSDDEDFEEWIDDETFTHDLPDELFEKSEDGSYTHLSIVDGVEFTQAYNANRFQSFGTGFAFQADQAPKVIMPSWRQIENPLVINMSATNFTVMKDAIEQQNRFIILYDALNENFIHMSGMMDGDTDDELSPMQTNFLFETNFESVLLKKPPITYLEEGLELLAAEHQYSLSPDVNKKKVIETLIDYRKKHFQGLVDIERLLFKVVRYVTGYVIDEQAFMRFFGKDEINLKKKNSQAIEKLQRLVGLENVKEELLRVVDRMKLVEKRKQLGLANIEHHLGAVFMGNPGTAKTTIARIFGQILFEEKVLTNNVFKEVSRKDLIGMYVGWTANVVQQVFDQAKGGTIFIDEAYSLMDNTSSSFSDEALAAIIQNMENNPDTLVIFAGYTDEMIRFVNEANPGLRSRLTNIVEFKDYEVNELYEIFTYHLASANYELENGQTAEKIVRAFVEQITSFGNKQTGNGRLMRKLLSTAISYMAMRKPDNVTLLLTEDLHLASEELLAAEQALQKNSARKTVGFAM